MNCAEMNDYLDRYLDGEINADQLRELEAHGAECPECAVRIRAAKQLKAMMQDMPAEEDVPLEAQARWRNAVRAESSARRKRQLYRIASVAAAVVVLAVGLGWGLNRNPKSSMDSASRMSAAENEIAYEMDMGAEKDAAFDSAIVESASSGAAYIETDGQPLAAEPQVTAKGAPMHEIDLKVDSVDEVCGQICDLAAEYEGEADIQRAEGSANVYVSIPADAVDDFVQALAQWDVSGKDLEVPGVAGEDVSSLLLVVSE